MSSQELDHKERIKAKNERYYEAHKDELKLKRDQHKQPKISRSIEELKESRRLVNKRYYENRRMKKQDTREIV